MPLQWRNQICLAEFGAGKVPENGARSHSSVAIIVSAFTETVQDCVKAAGGRRTGPPQFL